MNREEQLRSSFHPFLGALTEGIHGLVSRMRDQLDALLARFRPIEHLFQMMGAVGDTGDGAELVRGCSEIGLNLTGQFREELERVFGRDGEYDRFHGATECSLDGAT